ncbi:hypothetical protein EYC84_011626 [Monilinia fructicola]|uniref:Uncharacterized protein n=1 Tax=Monilinia fructicola TaxID=38448 RepID=A0A5M9JA41_MONFR|nr:hypothetical protein EYC84_011626 [Monilinia fructicola]
MAEPADGAAYTTDLRGPGQKHESTSKAIASHNHRPRRSARPTRICANFSDGGETGMVVAASRKHRVRGADVVVLDAAALLEKTGVRPLKKTLFLSEIRSP